MLELEDREASSGDLREPANVIGNEATFEQQPGEARFAKVDPNPPQAPPMPPNQSRVVRVMSSDLVQKFRSKQDLYQTLAVEFQYHLPVFDECSLVFLREVLAGRKLIFKLSELNCARVPRLTEFKTDILWNHAMNDFRARKYLPEPSNQKVRPVGRKFLFDVSPLLIHPRARSSTRSSQVTLPAKSRRHC